MTGFPNSERKNKRDYNPLGSAHTNPADAYRDVPILKQPTWNNEVAAYFFFGGLSAGAAMIGSLAEVVGGERHAKLARTAHFLSFATLLPCPPLLIDDLGYPARFHHMLRIFKPTSPMNLGSWALTIHGAGATVIVLNMLAREGKLPIAGFLFRLLPERALAAAGLPSSFALAGYTGVLLGTTSIPVWYTSPLLGALFMSSSLSSGAAGISLASAITGRHSDSTHAALGGLNLVFGAADLVLLRGYVATSGEAAQHLKEGRAGMLLKGTTAAIAASLVLDATGLIWCKHSRILSALSGVAGLAGAAMLRWGVVRAGAPSSADREGTLQAMRPRRGYPGWWPGRRGQATNVG